MKKSEPVQIVSGAWYAAGYGKEPHSEECCDCGLTHRIQYRVHNGRVEYRYDVDEDATKAARKRRGVKVVSTEAKPRNKRKPRG